MITAIETHFWWPALPTDLREVLRALKPGGRLIIIAEVYNGAAAFASRAAEKYAERTGMALFTVEKHHQLLKDAGYSDVQVITEPSKGWIFCTGSFVGKYVLATGAVFEARRNSRDCHRGNHGTEKRSLGYRY